MLATPEIIAAAAQRDRLAETLPWCFNRVPLYSSSGWGNGDVPALTLPGLWNQLPLITKQDIREDFPRNFLGDSPALEDLLEREMVELEHTSGTSEERTPLLLPRGWWAEQERSALGLNATIAPLLQSYRLARRATISSPVCSSDVCYTGVPSRNDRIVGDTLFLSLSRYPFLWSEAELDRMAAEAIEWDPVFLDVDPVYGVVFALHCERRGIKFPSLRFVLCSYEFLSVVHRRILQRIFQVPVLNLYGSTETGHLLMEDEQGKMRPSLETAFLEVVNEDARGIGELVVTTLTNDYMPLIRYWIGDLVEPVEQAYCVRYTVHGRVADAFLSKTCNRVTTLQIDRCFDSTFGVAHYQLIERASGPWQLRYVSEGAGPSLAQLSTLKDNLTGLLKLAVPVELRAMEMLAPESSGKFRLGYPLRKKAEVGSSGGHGLMPVFRG
jgi:phenylacetate-CoA ligase